MSFIFKITTTTSPQTFVIPCVNIGTFNATVDYGDGTGSQTVTAYNDSNLTHSFATAGQHTITIDGTFPNIRFYNNQESRLLVDEVVDLGDVGWVHLYRAFRDCSNLTTFNLGTGNTSNVTGMSQFFERCASLTTLDLSSLDTSSATDMSYMFQHCTGLTAIDLSNFDTSSVISMVSMFRNCTSLTSLDVSNFDTSSVAGMQEMFRDCSSLASLNISNFNTSSVTNMYQMFRTCSSLTTLDISSFDTSNIINMGLLFYNCSSLTALNVSSFDTSSVTSMSSMFYFCSSLTTLDLSNFNTSSVANMSTMFNRCSSLTALNVSSFDTSSATTMNQMFRDCRLLTTLDVSGFDTSSVISMAYMFYRCSELTNLNVSSFDTSSVTNMSVMFYDCSSLTTLDLSGFNTSSVINMAYMFYSCSSLTSLNVSNFNTSSVTNMSYMFISCSSLTTLDLSNFNTSSVTNMYQMFRTCSSLTALNVSSFGTSSVTTMDQMFNGCSSLTTLDLSGFNTSSVTTTGYMFSSCSSLTTLDLSNFNTSSVTNMSYMFANCTNLTNLDIKHFNISNITNGRSFLSGAYNVLTSTQYDELLEAWAVQDVQPNVAWHFGNAQYTVETIADWYSPRSASSLSLINNKLVSIADSTAAFGAAQQIDNLIVGKAYKIIGKATCSNNSATVYIRVSAISGLSDDILSINGTGSITVNENFIATATTVYVGALAAGHAANDTVTLDSGITVKEITNYATANAASEIEYSQENVFGSEEVVNGDFATDSDWVKQADWTISNGVAVCNSAGGLPGRDFSQNDILEIGKTYILSLDIVSFVSGSLSLYTGSVLSVGNSLGHKTVVFEAGVANLILAGFNGFVGSIDNVSVKEITNAVIYKNIPQTAREPYKFKADSWTGSNELVVNGDFSDNLSGWSETKTNQITTVVDGVCVIDSNGWSDSGITQNMALTLGKTYVLTFDTKFLSNFVAKKLTIYCGPYYDIVDIIDGKQEIVIKPTVTNYFAIRGTNAQTGINAIFSIANVSVKEVIEVEPIFTIDSLFINNEQGIWFDMGKE